MGKAAWSSGITVEQALQVLQPLVMDGLELFCCLFRGEQPKQVPSQAEPGSHADVFRRGREKLGPSCFCKSAPTRASFLGEMVRVVAGSGGGWVGAPWRALPSSKGRGAYITLPTKRRFDQRISSNLAPPPPNSPAKLFGSFNEG